MKKVLIGIIAAAVTVPVLLAVFLSGAVAGAFRGSENSQADLVEICVNHEPVAAPFLPSNGYEWVAQCRDDIWNARQSAVFLQSRGTASGKAVVSYARQFLGGPYVWGGNDPATGVDCSGFTKYVFAHFGIVLNRVAIDQAKNGSEVSRAEVQAGDLMIWSGHVALCEGNGMVIEAADERHGIREIEMNESYGHGSFMGYYRVNGLKDDLTENMQPMADQSVSSGRTAEEKAAAVLLAWGLMQEERYFGQSVPDWEAYAAAFTDDDFMADDYDPQKDRSWRNLQNRGFPAVDSDMMEDILMCAEMIHGRLSVTGGAVSLAALEAYSESQLLRGPEAEELWKNIFASASGGHFTVYTTVPGPDCGQCTDFAHWCFYETYGEDWRGSGNGNQCVDRICSWFSKESGRRTRDGFYFVKSRKPEAGAVFSTGFNEAYGHTGFITKVENGAFYASEGNYGRNTGSGYSNIRVNYRVAMDRAQNWTDDAFGTSRGGVWYAVPRRDE